MEKVTCSHCEADNSIKSKYCSSCGYELPKVQKEVSAIKVPEKKKKTSKNRNVIAGTISGIIFFAVSYFLVQHFLVDGAAYDKVLKYSASELNKSCPMMVDQNTRLDNAVALPNNVIQYNYTLVNLVKEEVIIDTVRKYIEPGLINNVKSNPDLKYFRDHNTTMIYSYRDRNGTFIWKLDVTPEMYKQ